MDEETFLDCKEVFLYFLQMQRHGDFKQIQDDDDVFNEIVNNHSSSQ